jgi:hypothetical protein
MGKRAIRTGLNMRHKLRDKHASPRSLCAARARGGLAGGARAVVRENVVDLVATWPVRPAMRLGGTPASGAYINGVNLYVDGGRSIA